MDRSLLQGVAGSETPEGSAAESSETTVPCVREGHRVCGQTLEVSAVVSRIVCRIYDGKWLRRLQQ